MVYTINASTFADATPAVSPSSSTSTNATNSVNTTSGLGAISAFERLLLMQIGVSLPPQSAYHDSLETDEPHRTKESSGHQIQTPPVKVKADETSAVANFYFIPAALRRDATPAIAADLHPVTSGTSDLSPPQNEAVTDSKPSSTAITDSSKSDELAKKESDPGTFTMPEGTDTSTVEPPKHNSDAAVTNKVVDAKASQPSLAESIPILVPQQLDVAITQPLVSSSIRSAGPSNSETRTTGGVKNLFESTISTSLLAQEGRSPSTEQNSSDAGSHDGSADDSNQPSQLIDPAGTNVTSFIPALTGLAGARISGLDTSSTISRQLSTAIVDRLNEAQNEGPTTVRIRLEQANLGTVDLHLSVQNGIVSIRIAAQDPLTQQLINGQMDDLRQSLNQRGVNWGELQVTDDRSGRHFNENEGSRPGAIRITPTSPSTRPSNLATSSGQSTGSLNYVA